MGITKAFAASILCCCFTADHKLFTSLSVDLQKISTCFSEGMYVENVIIDCYLYRYFLQVLTDVLLIVRWLITEKSI